MKPIIMRENDFYMQYHVKMIIQVLLTYVPIQIYYGDLIYCIFLTYIFIYPENVHF